MFTNRIRLRVALSVAMVVACVSLAMAGTTGTISGVVKDAASGVPIPNANITIVGTTVGAASLSNGEFFIIYVSAGTYSVQASVIGYKPVVIENVLVTPDFTTQLDFKLEQTVAATLTPITVRAERPLVQRDATATVRILDSKQYEALPTRGYQDAAAIQSGVVSSQGSTTGDVQGNETTNNPVLFIRGGRSNEVAYYVDGFSQQDPLTGYSTTAINTNAVQQVVVMTGGFNAEYGRIMSGAVNVVTREGAKKYFGTLEAMTDNLAPMVGAKKYDNNIYDFSLGGPIAPGNENITYFVSGERRWSADRSPRSEAGGRLPHNSLGGYTWQGKLNWKLTPGLTLKGGTLSSLDNWEEYLHQYTFDVQHMPRYEDRNYSYFGSLTKNFSANTIANISANFFSTERKRGDSVAFDDLLGYGRLKVTRNSQGQIVKIDTLGNRLQDPLALFWASDSQADTVFTPGRAYNSYLHRKSDYLGLAGDMETKWSEHNSAKLGADYQYHTLRYFEHLFPANAVYGIDKAGYVDVINYGYNQTGDKEVDGASGIYEDGAKHPVSASVFAQNKYEYNDFVLNAGLRYDYLDPKTASLANENLPLGSGSILLPSLLKDSNKKNRISPRLGVGFPVSVNTLFHANYGIFYQQPELQNLYTSYRYLEYKVQSGGYYYAFGNPNLVPETTTAYEVGLTHALSPTLRVDATAYYKDVQDLVEVQNVPSSPKNFASYRNTDFGTIKGLDFNLQLVPTRGLSGSLSYSLSYASGTGSVSNTQRNIAWQASTTTIPPKQTAALAFDQRHKFVLNVDLSGGPESGPKLLGRYVLENMGLNVLFNAASGFPYTPILVQNEVTLAAVSTTPAGPINSRYGPWTYRTDLKLTRGFQVGGLDLKAYVWALNLFDTVNALSVYSGTGSASTDGWLSTPDGTKWAQDNGPSAVKLYQLKLKDPNNYGAPRQVRFGLKTSF
jgi:outer membrane receptor protein involved in Fe transport